MDHKQMVAKDLLAGLGVTDEKLDAWRKAHQDIRLLTIEVEPGDDPFVCVAFTPERQQLQAFAGDMAKEDKLKANNNLVVDCLLAPDPAQLRDLLRRWPGLAIAIANKLLALAKVGTEVCDTRL